MKSIINDRFTRAVVWDDMELLLAEYLQEASENQVRNILSMQSSQVKEDVTFHRNTTLSILSYVFVAIAIGTITLLSTALSHWLALLALLIVSCFHVYLGAEESAKFAVSNVKFFGEMFIEIAKRPEYVAFTLGIVLMSRMLISYFWTSSSSSKKKKNNNISSTINSEEISKLVKLHLDRAVKDLKVSLASSEPSSDVSAEIKSLHNKLDKIINRSRSRRASLRSRTPPRHNEDEKKSVEKPRAKKASERRRRRSTIRDAVESSSPPPFFMRKKPADSKKSSEKDSSTSSKKSKVEEDTSSPFVHPKKKTTKTTTNTSVKKRTPPVRRWPRATFGQKLGKASPASRKLSPVEQKTSKSTTKQTEKKEKESAPPVTASWGTQSSSTTTPFSNKKEETESTGPTTTTTTNSWGPPTVSASSNDKKKDNASDDGPPPTTTSWSTTPSKTKKVEKEQEKEEEEEEKKKPEKETPFKNDWSTPVSSTPASSDFMSQLSTSTNKKDNQGEANLKQEETKKDAEVKPAQQQQGDDDDDDWVEIEDQNSGRTYFWNRTTNTTQWNKPNTYTNVNGVKVEAS